MFKKVIYSFLFFAFCTGSFAQEEVRPLITNINYLYGDLKPIKDEQAYSNYNKRAVTSSTASTAPIFLDDFSYAYLQSYPNQALWSDSSTYVNTTFAIAPWSIGVATFDGLNKHGYPYTPNLVNQQLALPADTLTSKAIDLSTYAIGDSLALTFYYQARGRGDSPELIDSLLLDYYIPAQNKWRTVWYQRGNSSANTNDTVFKRGFVRLDSAYYLQSGFKFRFRNKATTVGNFDHWHLDYVLLNAGNDMNVDTCICSKETDFAFGYIPTPFLKNYAAIPWRQYDTTDMRYRNSVFIRSNRAANTVLTYTNAFYDNNNVQTAHIYTSSVLSIDMGANSVFFKYKGWVQDITVRNPRNLDSFPLMTGPVDYKIKHVIHRSSNDYIPANDTVLQHQIFSNFFAFDDGSAEGGYYINGTGGRMAGKYVLKKSDTLRSVRIYFDQVGLLTSQIYSFRIKIWIPGTNGPSNSVFYKDSVRTPNYFPNGSINSFSDYYLPTPLVLNAGTYYIGIQQESASGVVVGFDKNLDHHTNFYYDSGNGWTQSSIYGSIMIRPVFGVHKPVSVKEFNINKTNLFSVYPNPASENIIVHSEQFEKGSYTIINSIGQKITEGNIENASQTIKTENLSNGLYFLILKINDKIVQQNKIIIQH